MSDDLGSSMFSRLRPRRVVVEEDPAGTLRRGWEAFGAGVATEGDGDMSCTATIWYRKHGSRKAFKDGVAGSTGSGRGHAEMDALYTLIQDVFGGDVETFRQFELMVSCPSKPCCCRCAAVLGLLGVAAESGTNKSPRGMGSTQWGIPDGLTRFVGAYAGVNPNDFREFWRFQYD